MINNLLNKQTQKTAENLQILRKPGLVEKVVFVDGQPGCGKSMFSAIIASLERVEKLTLAYEIEFICALKFLDKIGLDVAKALIALHTDLKIYDLMMSRETNFRPSDVSSIFRDPKPFRYIKRLFQEGDLVIPQRIKNEKPILHLTTHDLLSRAEPVFCALGDRVIFIEIVRHPLYMLKQQSLNMQNLLSNPRHFEIYFSYKDHELPYFAYELEEQFVNGNATEKAIFVIEGMTKKTENLKNKFLCSKKTDNQIITIAFENFVTNPWEYLTKIENALETKKTKATHKMLKKQKIPRKKFADGIGLKVYKRCGWEPSNPVFDENEELAKRKEFAKERVSKKAMDLLIRLCKEYEKKYLGKEFGY